ncbi:MAG: NAD(P)-binding domain-containing protein [Propionibacteriales bacterium]|nr:NAD(P)-binding domain-containing protein [Propionibacteriales bacterium]
MVTDTLSTQPTKDFDDQRHHDRNPGGTTTRPDPGGLEPVTVIGLGPMGQAMARALHAGGHPVTVWNRTASRAVELVGEGVRLAESPRDAVEASELVLLSLTDYRPMYEILSTTLPALAGRTVVNLSSDTPERTREAADWMGRRGAAFVAGGVMVPAPMVGTAASYVYYSGAESAITRHRDTLARIGEPRVLGSDPALAQVMYQAQLDVFLSESVGIDVALPRAIQGYYRQVIADGHGSDNWTRILDAIKAPAATA